MKKILLNFVKLVLVTFVVIVIFLFGAAIYLSPQDKLEKTDSIVVISGGDTDQRIKEGVKLYQENYAQKIIFSGAAAEGEVSNASAMRTIAISKGIPAKDILIEEQSRTTDENALDSAKIIHDQGFQSIILVTSPYHQRRAYEAFRKSLGKDFKIINHSALDKEWRKADWWANEQARFLTIGEIMKNLYAVLNK